MNELWHRIAARLTAKHHKENKLPKVISGAECSVVIWVEDEFNCFLYAHYDTDNDDLWWHSSPKIRLKDGVSEVYDNLNDVDKKRITAYLLGSHNDNE